MSAELIISLVALAASLYAAVRTLLSCRSDMPEADADSKNIYSSKKAKKKAAAAKKHEITTEALRKAAKSIEDYRK